MSKYSEISKKIGHAPRHTISLPSQEKAKDLLIKIINDHDAKAFEEVFIYYRYVTDIPATQEATMEIISEAYKAGEGIFKNIE